MNYYNKIAKSFFFPLNDVLLGNKFTKQFNFLMKSQWYTLQKIEEYQNIRLRRLIHHAYDNVPFYNKILKEKGLSPSDIKSSEDLHKLPIINKKIVRENMPNNIVAKNFSRSKLRFVGSSGSTGEPLQYFINSDAYDFNRLCYLRGWYWMGYSLGDKYTKLSTNPLTSGSKKIQNLLFRCMYIPTNDLDTDKISTLFHVWCGRKDSVIRSYPSVLYIIAKHMLDNSLILPHSPIAINTTGEILFDYMRVTIEKAFGCPVFDSYSGEAGATVFQCEKGSYHIASEYAITEILDKNDAPVKKGRNSIN